MRLRGLYAPLLLALPACASAPEPGPLPERATVVTIEGREFKDTNPYRGLFGPVAGREPPSER
ncbi:MAG TPA: hypothetical protein VJB16_05355 [archaeon]|nr:hypothetical protein [archaeon]